jgi:hypothetical protein
VASYYEKLPQRQAERLLETIRKEWREFVGAKCDEMFLGSTFFILADTSIWNLTAKDFQTEKTQEAKLANIVAKMDEFLSSFESGAHENITLNEFVDTFRL